MKKKSQRTEDLKALERQSPYEARLLGAEHRDAWDGLWKRAGEPLAFAWEFAEAAAAGAGAVRRAGVLSQNGELIAGAAFVERSARGLSLWRHLLPAPSAGLLLHPEKQSESAIRDCCFPLAMSLEHRASMIEMVFPPAFPDLRAFQWRGHGWRASPHYSYLSPISAPGDLSRQAENSARRQGKKASAAGYRLMTGHEVWPALLRLWKETQHRQGIPAYVKPDCFQRLMEWLVQEENNGRHGCLIAGIGRESPEDIEAAGFFAWDSQRVYYLLGGSKIGQEKGTGAPTLLHFAVTDWLAEKLGRPYLYDWVGANTPYVVQFKKSFRPQLELNLRLVWKSRLGKILIPG